MDSAGASLLDNDDQLTAEVIKLRDAVKEKDQRIEQLLDYIVLLRKRQFGASADRPNKDQIPLFDEAELEQLMAELGLASDEGDEAESRTQHKATRISGCGCDVVAGRHYPSRSDCMGSVRDALRAGTRLAITATPASRRATADNIISLERFQNYICIAG